MGPELKQQGSSPHEREHHHRAVRAEAAAAAAVRKAEGVVPAATPRGHKGYGQRIGRSEEECVPHASVRIYFVEPNKQGGVDDQVRDVEEYRNIRCVSVVVFSAVLEKIQIILQL